MKETKNKILVILSIILIIIDQLSKLLIMAYVKVPIGNDYFKIEVVSNTGIAFGFNNSSNITNILLSLIVIALIIRFIKVQNERIDNKTMVVLSLMISGGISNVIDRFIRGGVIDFIKIMHFPIFNIADIFIVVGWVLLVVFILLYSSKKIGD
jgi:signal peptidase II